MNVKGNLEGIKVIGRSRGLIDKTESVPKDYTARWKQCLVGIGESCGESINPSSGLAFKDTFAS